MTKLEGIIQMNMNLKYRKLINCIILLFLGNIYISYTQGFDWQFSTRFPSEIPDTFVGAGFEYSFLQSNGDFNLLEQSIPCCSFKDGSGKQFGVSAAYERWIDGLSAININLGYFYSTSEFNADKSEPVRDNIFTTRYTFESQISSVTAGISYKKRIEEPGFYLSGGLDLNLIISSSGNHSETALSDGVPFDRRILDNGGIDDLSLIVFTPFLKIGTDLPLGVGIYASPYFKLSYTLNSMLINQSWRRLGMNFGINIYRMF